MSNIYHDTFAGAIEAAATNAAKAGVVFHDLQWTADIAREPVNYGETRRMSVPVFTYKGRVTRKHFQVVLYRLDSGTYELTTYVL